MFQSAYRSNHSTETALINIFGYISLSFGTRRNAGLYLLDMSDVFATQKHSVLVDRLREIGLQDQTLNGFSHTYPVVEWQ